MTITDSVLGGWTGPSSATEQDKQARAERMVREAIDGHSAFEGMSYSIYAKGSYANNTNVRSDSDVDIVVECREAIYWQEHDPSAGGHPASSSYAGEWTPEKLRTEVRAALQGKFGAAAVSEGSAAFTVRSNTVRVDADVVPSFTFEYWFSDGTHRVGTKIFKRDGGTIVNYPKLQLANGRAKNTRTNGNYKKAVRILKRLENRMNDEGVHNDVPSYLLECLIYNCPDEYLMRDSWREVMRGCLAYCFNQTRGAEPAEASDRLVEVNEAKYLFSSSQKWTRAECHAFTRAAWDYMGFDE